jgi:hypothetical protein
MVASPADDTKGDEARQQKSRPPLVSEESEEELRGLCINCANRKHCLYRKPEGGVWHCEEYAEDRRGAMRSEGTT